MELRTRLSVFCCIAACLFMIAVPLVSEATYGGRGGTATAPVLRETVYVEVARPTEPEEVTDEGSPSVTEDSTETVSSPSDGETAVELPPPETTSDEKEVPTVKVLHADTGEISVMTLEDYIVCVVAAEMPYTFHGEALKAQAVAARSYCLYKMENGHTHEVDADVCTSYAHCAAFVSKEELTERYGSKTADRILKKIGEAVAATEGEVITYKGQPALALFHASSWQYTEASENVWGGKLPYLVSVSTPEADSISTVTVTEEALTRLFSHSSAQEVSVGVPGQLTSESNGTGRTAYLFYGGKGLTGKKVRSLLGLRSCDFEYEKTEDGWLFTVHGHGHGVGMSQYGANTMAVGGADYRDILTHYYTGVTVERGV